jgi:dihydropteroate synthase
MEKARTKPASDAVSIEDDERHVEDVSDYIRRNRDALNVSIKRSRAEVAKGKHSKKSVGGIIAEGKARQRAAR